MAPLTVKQLWSLPGDEHGALLEPGEELILPLEVPELGVKEARVPEGWRGIILLGLYGTIGDGKPD